MLTLGCGASRGFFPGQTETAAITRALPLVKDLESRIGAAKELSE